jgi:hypothetical protein
MRELLPHMIPLYLQATTVKKRSKLLDALLSVEILCSVRTIIYAAYDYVRCKTGIL